MNTPDFFSQKEDIVSIFNYVFGHLRFRFSFYAKLIKEGKGGYFILSFLKEFWLEMKV